MLIRNVDVADGLLNCTRGTINAFVDTLAYRKDSYLHPIAKSDSHYLMQKYPNAVPLEPVEIKFKTFKGKRGIDIIRKQFPLQLRFKALHWSNWLCLLNIHITTDKHA